MLKAVSTIAAGSEVTSVGLSLLPTSIFTVTGSPVTTTGTLTGSIVPQVNNLVWAGPATTGTVAPIFRALVNADLPAITNTAKTANYTVTSADSKTVFNNGGAAGTVVMTLPTGASGLSYGFYVAAAQPMQIVAGAGATINIGTTQSGTAGNAATALVGSYLGLNALSATAWYAASSQGSWTIT